VAQENRHLTTEQLSDFLSGEVSVQEQVQWESHLKNCPLCQQELASLRQVVAMLHALPSPVLPRSFVLSLETVETAEPVALPVASVPTPISSTRRGTWKPYIRVVMRTVSTIAAVIGVVFLLSALLAGVGGGGMSTAMNSTGAVKTSAPHSDTVDPRTSAPSNGATATSQAKGTPTFASGRATPTLPSAASLQPTQSVESTFNNQQGTSSSAWFSIFTQSAPTARLGVGMLLIIFGIMGFVLFKRQAHH